MKPENELALIIAFYLAKYNREAVINLGFSSFRQTFDVIGERIGVKPNTVKNMRDQFDPLYDARVGWYQRKLPPSRQRVVDAFDSVSEIALRSLVRDAIASRDFASSNVAKELFHAITGPIDGAEVVREPFLQRGATGKSAEKFFLEQFRNDKTPFAGDLFDARDLGAGFDFRISSHASEVFIEVKGLADNSGGISFTDKEWSVAAKKQGAYYAAVISHLNTAAPRSSYLRNPSLELTPKRCVSAAVAVSWQVSATQLSRVLTV